MPSAFISHSTPDDFYVGELESFDGEAALIRIEEKVPALIAETAGYSAAGCLALFISSSTTSPSCSGPAAP